MKMYNIAHAVNEFVPMVAENKQSLKFILSEEKSEQEKMFDDVMSVYKKNPMKPMTVGYAAGQKGYYEPELIKSLAVMLDYASQVGFLGKDRLVHIANGNLEPPRCWNYVYSKELMNSMETEMRAIAEKGKPSNLKTKIKSYIKLEKILTNEANERHIKRVFETKQEMFEPEELRNLSPEKFIILKEQFFRNGIGCYSELSENLKPVLSQLQKSGARAR